MGNGKLPQNNWPRTNLMAIHLLMAGSSGWFQIFTWKNGGWTNPWIEKYAEVKLDHLSKGSGENMGRIPPIDTQLRICVFPPGVVSNMFCRKIPKELDPFGARQNSKEKMKTEIWRLIEKWLNIDLSSIEVVTDWITDCKRKVSQQQPLKLAGLAPGVTGGNWNNS